MHLTWIITYMLMCQYTKNGWLVVFEKQIKTQNSNFNKCDQRIMNMRSRTDDISQIRHFHLQLFHTPKTADLFLWYLKKNTKTQKSNIDQWTKRSKSYDVLNYVAYRKRKNLRIRVFGFNYHPILFGRDCVLIHVHPG